jgi:hypothetical protein
LLAAVGLLAAHTLSFQRVVVDNTSLVLLLIIVASPFVAAIKKIKIGEFEAEIQPDEVKQVAEQVAQVLPGGSLDTTPPPSRNDTGAAVLELVHSDPVVGLAKLRIEIESRLRRLAGHGSLQSRQRRPAQNLGRIVRDLSAREVIDPPFGASLLDVIAICNRAIHGEDIRDVDARQIAESGVELLDVLDRIVRSFASTHPVKSTVISADERDSFDSARFRLTTIVPLVENPERREYELSLAELDDFFDNYSEFAEFVIRVEQIEDRRP